MASQFRFATRICGIYFLMVSSLGIYFNVSVFVHFVSLDRSSFHLMCISKCISNFLALFIYFAYIGPTCLLYQYLLSDFWDKYLNGTLAYGIFLQGSMTQLLITINRFLVVFSNSTATAKYSNRVTVAVLAGCWLVSAYVSVLVGLPDVCLTRFRLSPLGWDSSSNCIQFISKSFLYITIVFGLFSNSMNLLIAVKLAILSRTKSLSSEVCRRRRRKTIRFFLQSLCQDWLYALEMFSCWVVLRWAQGEIYVFMTTMGCDVMVSVIDGFIMFMFNTKFKAGSSNDNKNLKKVSTKICVQNNVNKC